MVSSQLFLKRPQAGLIVLGVVAALLLAACGSTTGTTTTPTSTPTTATATLKHVPVGTATLSWDPATQMLTVKLTLTGLAPMSMHPSHIHTGSCSNQGNVVYPLTTIAADDRGDATVTSMIPAVAGGIPATGWYVNVHNGPGLSDADQFLPIVCGDVANSGASITAKQSVTIAMTAAPSASAGQAAMGMAKLTLNGTTLTVEVTLSGLVPNSEHAAHIHKGSCQLQGAVIHPLMTIKADAQGNATVTTTVQNVTFIPATGWYVNIHRANGSDLSTSTGFDPIACGNVVVG